VGVAEVGFKLEVDLADALSGELVPAAHGGHSDLLTIGPAGHHLKGGPLSVGGGEALGQPTPKEGGGVCDGVSLSLFKLEEAPAGPDVAYTPIRLAASIVAAMQDEGMLHGLTWEPHAGGGAIVQALEDARVKWVASTLEPADSRTLTRRFGREIPARDALLPCPWTPFTVLGNPPFSSAGEHVRAALRAVQARPVW